MPNLEINRKQFVEHFTTVAACVPSKTPKEVLKNVLLSTDGTTLSLSATDTEIHVRAEMPLQSERVHVLIPTARMLNVLREVTGETITIDVQKDRITIVFGLSDIDLSITDAAEFPEVPTFDADAYFVLSRPALLTAIKQTQFCTDLSNARYALASLHLEPTGDTQIAIAATDSKRLAVATCGCSAVNNPVWEPGGTNVPVKAMRLVEKILESEEFDAQISVTGNTASFRIGSVSICAQLVQGRFPQFQKVLAQCEKPKRKVTVPVSALSAVMRQAMLVVSEETRGIDVQFGAKELTASLTSASVGRAKAKMPLAEEGEEIGVLIDGTYLSTVLRVLDPSSSVEIHLIDAERAIMLVSGDYKYMAMPLSRE